MILQVYKRIGETTSELANRVKHEYGANKVAVCGKLDPMARGLTSVLTDDKTKLMEQYMKRDKTYEFKIIFGIKTDTDDIMGLVNGFEQSGCRDEDIINYKKAIDEICSCTTQHFHPFSAIKIRMNGKRQSLHQWTLEKKMSIDDLPIKSVNVITKEYGDPQKLCIHAYYKHIKERLSKISSLNRTTFRVPEIECKWDEVMQTIGQSDNNEVLILPVKLRVSSGFYIRMLPYYLKEQYNIPAHIYDIHRTEL